MPSSVHVKKNEASPFADGSYPVPLVRIEQKTALLAALLQHSDHGITCIDATGIVVEMNTCAGRVFGVDPLSSKGTTLDTLPKKAQDALRVPYRKASKGVSTSSVTLCGAKPGKPGSFARWRSRFLPIVDVSGLVQFVVVLSSRISDSQELTEERDQFLALLGHTVRTPLTTLNASLSILERSETEPETVSRMRAATRALAEQTDNMLLAADIVAGHVRMCRKSVNLRSLVESVRDTIDAHGVSITLHGARHVPVRADRKHLTRALCELLKNALTHSSPGDTVRITVHRSPTHARVRICDSGSGIHPEDLPHIFDRYHRVSGAETHGRAGIGLGLYLAKEIVARHDGSIHIENDTTKGAVALLTLPIDAVHQ